MTHWTEEQERAIALSDRRLLISAAAGSGKTAVLTERIVARVLDPKHPVDIDELLIMTFTRAAAAEMRERIRRRLEDCLQQALRDGESGIVSRAKRELAELDAARITTIDSFCLTVLREHADRLAVDPAFRVGSEEELRILQNDVLEELLEEQYEKADPAFLRFADAFSQGKADLGIGEEILALYRFAESLPWPEEWLLRVEAEAERTDGNLSESAYQRYMAEEFRKLGAELCGFAEEAQLLCEEGGLNGYEGAVQSDLGKLQRLRAAEDYPAACLALTAFQTYDRLGRNRKDSDPDCASRVKSLREFWKKALKKPLEAFGRGDAEAADRVEDAETVRTLIGLARDFSARFLAKKREKNLLDFSDLEHETLALFWESDAAGKRHPSEIAREYQATFREIYVDEYQDSNGVQEELLRAIETGRLFLVGDIKQSIYGFRHAKLTAAQWNPGLIRGWISAKISEAAKRCSRVAMPFFRISCAKNSAASATMRMRRSIRGRRFRYLRAARTAMRPNSCWSRGTQRARRQRQLSRQRLSRPASGSCLTRQRGFGFRTAKAASERLLTVTLRFYSARLPGRRSALSKC